MAKLLRDAYVNDLVLPRLDGLTPVQIFLEMGLERLRRIYVDEFLKKGFLWLIHDKTCWLSISGVALVSVPILNLIFA